MTKGVFRTSRLASISAPASTSCARVDVGAARSLRTRLAASSIGDIGASTSAQRMRPRWRALYAPIKRDRAQLDGSLEPKPDFVVRIDVHQAPAPCVQRSSVNRSTPPSCTNISTSRAAEPRSASRGRRGGPDRLEHWRLPPGAHRFHITLLRGHHGAPRRPFLNNAARPALKPFRDSATSGRASTNDF